MKAITVSELPSLIAESNPTLTERQVSRVIALIEALDLSGAHASSSSDEELYSNIELEIGRARQTLDPYLQFVFTTFANRLFGWRADLMLIRGQTDRTPIISLGVPREEMELYYKSSGLDGLSMDDALKRTKELVTEWKTKTYPNLGAVLCWFNSIETPPPENELLLISWAPGEFDTDTFFDGMWLGYKIPASKPVFWSRITTLPAERYEQLKPKQSSDME